MTVLRVLILLLALGLNLETVMAQTPSAAGETETKRTPRGENEETLFNTLNETLEENRKIRSNLKEFQQALQKKTIESEDLKSELRKLEGLALERNRELGQKIAELDKQIKESAAAQTLFENEKKSFQAEKKKINEETRTLQTENSKLRKLLANAVLSEEKEEILKVARENSESAAKAESRLSELNSQNQVYRGEIATAYYEMGNVLYQSKRYAEAAAAYKKVLSYDAANAWAYHNLAVIEDYHMNDRASAKVHYQHYLNYKPASEDAQEVRRRILDINLLDKVSPDNPLQKDFEKFAQESRTVKV